LLLLILLWPLGAWAQEAAGASPPAAGDSAPVVESGSAGSAASGAETETAADGQVAAEDSAAAPEAGVMEEAEQPCTCEKCEPRAGTLQFYGPLSAINTHPPNLLFLAPPPEAAAVLEPGAQYAHFKLDYTNVIILERDHKTWIEYDYEGARAAVEYHRGLRRGELSVQLPYYYRDRGWLDPVMAAWHGWFGMLNGWRDILPDNRYRYTIRTREGLVYSDGPGARGVGDLSVGYKRELWNRGDGADAASLRVMVKAPTGDPDFAFGSGNWDYSLGALYQRQLRAHLRAYANVDYVFTGAPDWNISANDLLISNWVLEYAVSPRTTVLAQYRINTNPLRTGSKEADKNAQELTFGFNHRVQPDMVWSGGFIEDINPETAPDLVLSTDLKWEF
jgi:hypothetical protein